MNASSYSMKLQGFHLNAIRDIAFSYGVSIDSLCESLGVNLNGHLNFRDLDKIVGLLCDEIERPWAALEFSGRINFHQFGTLGPLIASSCSSKEAVQLFVRYHQLIHPCFRVDVANCENGRVLIQKMSEKEMCFPRWHAEAMFGCVVNWGHLLVEKTVCIDEIWFRHSKPSYAEAYHDVFKCENIHFDSLFDGIAFNESYMDLKIRTSSPRFHARLKDAADAQLRDIQQFSGEVKVIILSKLPSDCSLEQVAEILNLSIRTLQRKLEESDTNLKKLKQEVKLQEAMKMLEKTSLSIERISLRLGYAQRSSFCGAFQKWTGCSPGEWREKKQISTVI